MASPPSKQYSFKNLGAVRRGKELVTNKNKEGHMLFQTRELIARVGIRVYRVGLPTECASLKAQGFYTKCKM